MKKQMGLLFSVGLLLSVGTTRTEETVRSLGQDVLWGAVKEKLPMPDNMNKVSVTVASICGTLGGGLYLGANTLVGLADGKVGQVIEKATLNNVGAADLLRATGLVTGISGALCLYKDGNTNRRDFLSAVAGNFLLQQAMNPGKIEADEAKKTVLQAFFALAAFKQLAGVIPGTEEYKNRRRSR